jgi:hypothetical protein
MPQLQHARSLTGFEAAWGCGDLLSVGVFAQDPDSRAVINRLFGVEQHTSLRNEESGESIEVGRMPLCSLHYAPLSHDHWVGAGKPPLLLVSLFCGRPLERDSADSTLGLVDLAWGCECVGVLAEKQHHSGVFET